MTINSNEEYLPIGNLNCFAYPYYMVSCRNNETEMVCIAESEKNAVRFSFSNYAAFRITLSAFRDYDMRNRFCNHLIYEIKNSFYLEQVCSFYNKDEIKNYHHILLNLDDTIVDVIVSGDINYTVADGLNKVEDDINDNIVYAEVIKSTAIQLGQCKFFDLYEDKHREVCVPIENIFGDFMLTSFNYGSIDLLLTIKPISSHEDGRTIQFPEILCVKETSIFRHGIDNQELKLSNLSESVLYEVQNSNFIEWMAYAGYRQLYGEPKNLRHIRIKLQNMIYDVILDSKEKRPIIIKEEKQVDQSRVQVID
jgi:hypothetical protein